MLLYPRLYHRKSDEHVHMEDEVKVAVGHVPRYDDRQRQEAELEFVASEAWLHRDEQRNAVVYRRLCISTAGWVLQHRMPKGYPGNDECLQVDGSVDDVTNKVAFRALSELLKVCRETAESMPGEEALLPVFSAAENWIHEKWENAYEEDKDEDDRQQDTASRQREDTSVLLGRRLIYSHHIIAKRARASIQQLARDFALTGYVKIGWPGLIIVEGREEDCQNFYDAIRGWCWQYLVVRGEMQETVPSGSALEAARRFSVFQEVQDMSIVANSCREVGLEALFRTSMKIYESDSTISSPENGPSLPYGALVHVDHMNDGKSYRKTLRKTCHELGVSFFVQQCFPGDDYSKRPTILVGLVGGDVGSVLKQWRTRKVDVNTRGRPCLERMTTVLVEGPLHLDSHDVSWEDLSKDDRQLNRHHITEQAETVTTRRWWSSLDWRGGKSLAMIFLQMIYNAGQTHVEQGDCLEARGKFELASYQLDTFTTGASKLSVSINLNLGYCCYRLGNNMDPNCTLVYYSFTTSLWKLLDSSCSSPKEAGQALPRALPYFGLAVLPQRLGLDPLGLWLRKKSSFSWS
jgi:acylphosphatase